MKNETNARTLEWNVEVSKYWLCKQKGCLLDDEERLIEIFPNGFQGAEHDNTKQAKTSNS